MDLLVPAGSEESLKAAILGGADAVYLGPRDFGARRLADNFSDSGIMAATHLAHRHGVEVHVTVNTLVKERELREALSLSHFLEEAGVDAIIVQDRGLLNLLRDEVRLPVHASTQMGIHTPEGAEWAEENGISRIILPRELELGQIRAIRESTDLELEVFIHGALCYSVSGQCLFSSLAGGRSGNRGLCAQPCRKRYSHPKGGTGHLLSPADMWGAEAIPELMDMGIDCLKIEGRMRSPIYVFIASKAYRGMIERAGKGVEPIGIRERELLEVAFNRGFTKGHLQGDRVMKRSSPDHKGRYLGEARKQGKRLILPRGVERGDGITLHSGGEKVGGFEIKDLRPHGRGLSIKPPFPLRKDRYQVYKTKDREFDHLMDLIGSVRMPHAEGRRKPIDLEIPSVHRRGGEAEISCYLDSLEGLEACVDHADRIYFELNGSLEGARDLCDEHGVECVTVLPRVSSTVPRAEGPLMVSSLGQYQAYRERWLFGSYFLNVFNSQVIPRMHQHTLSVELTREEMVEVMGHTKDRLEIMGFGRLEMMVTRDDSLPEGQLIDSGGRRFPVVKDGWGYTHILNCADLLLLDHMEEIDAMGADSVGLDLRGRNSGLCREVTKAFKERDLRAKDSLKKGCGQLTTGHYLRGVA